MIKTLVVSMALAAALPTGHDANRQTAPPVVTKLIGSWSGTGTVTGRASEITMTWERAVGDAFVRLRFKNVMAASATRPSETFESHGYYRVAADGASGTGTWIDSRGLILPVKVALTPDSFTSDWGDSSTEVGRTVYKITSAGALEVVDFVRAADGQYREFGRSQLRR